MRTARVSRTHCTDKGRYCYRKLQGHLVCAYASPILLAHTRQSTTPPFCVTMLHLSAFAESLRRA